MLYVTYECMFIFITAPNEHVSHSALLHCVYQCAIVAFTMISNWVISLVFSCSLQYAYCLLIYQ